jgi:mitochondrial enoyl-[acyl-carrier protein] reductase / trans-2-enoyl-CoA reductase
LHLFYDGVFSKGFTLWIPLMRTALYYEKTGTWQDVVHLGAQPLRAMGSYDVRIKPRYSPINPSDFNMMEGSYAHQPEPPVILGREGVGQVLEIGDAVHDIAVGDYVISIAPHPESGFWCSEMILAEDTLMVVPVGCDLKQAAMMTINPLTAWVMLTTYLGREFQPGEAVIQNAANSGVGIALGQLAQWRGIPVSHIVRSADSETQLRGLGFDQVYRETALHEGTLRRLGKEQSFVLGLNGVGGDNSALMSKCLAKDGLCLTYGAMSRAPLILSNALLIYKNIRFQGFLRSDWVAKTPLEMVRAQYRVLFEAMMEGVLQMPIHAVFPMVDFREALTCASQSGRVGKVLFTL